MIVLLGNLVRCILFLLVPTAVIAVGLWLVIRFLGIQHRAAYPVMAVVFGVAFFGATIAGMLLDEKAAQRTIVEILRIAGLAGLGGFLSALAVVPFLRATIIRRD